MIFGFRNLPYTVDDVAQAVKDTVSANGFQECYIRPLLYLKAARWNLNVDAGKPAVMIAVWEWRNYLGEEALDKRDPRQYLILHASSSQCDDDQGKDRGQLCQQYSWQRPNRCGLGFRKPSCSTRRDILPNVQVRIFFWCEKERSLHRPLRRCWRVSRVTPSYTIANDLGYEVTGAADLT